MKSIKKRILARIALFMALLLLAGAAVSCSSGGKDPAAETGDSAVTDKDPGAETEEAAETEPPSPVVERNFEGYNFRFLNGNTSYAHNTLIFEEDTADNLDSAMYQRNLKVEERFNITLSEEISGSPQADYSASVTADDYSFDIALLRMEWAFPVVINNQTVNWGAIPNIDLSADYWVQDSVKRFSLLNNVYFAVSAFDITHYDSTRAFCFNKNLAEKLMLESPYDLVRDGKWTLDKYYEMNMAAASDANGNGAWDNGDTYGTSVGGDNTYGNVIVNTLMTGIGSILSIGKDENDLPYFNLDEEYYMDRILKVTEMMKSRSDGLIGGDFKSGNALFYNNLITQIATNFRDMDDEFGIIPTPKYDEEQKEYINLGGSPFFMVIPIVSDDLDRTGAVMEGLAYDSLGLVDVAYYETLLQRKVSRDKESAEMLDLIFSTLQYYHPLANEYLNAPMADDLIWNSSTRIASYFQAVKKTINSAIENAIKTYQENVVTPQ